MVPSSFGPYHGLWLKDAPSPNKVHRRHPPTIGYDEYAWFGIIPSAARAVGSIIEGTKMLGVMARRKVPKLAQNIFNNQQRLVVVMEGSGGGGADGG